MQMPTDEELRTRYMLDVARHLRDQALHEGQYGNPYAMALGALLETTLKDPQHESLTVWICSETRSALEDQAARDLTAAARRKEEDRLVTEALTVDCPWCGATPGHRCRTTTERAILTEPHQDRLRLARGLLPNTHRPMWPKDLDPELKTRPEDLAELAKLDREARNVVCPWCHAEADSPCLSAKSMPTVYHLWRIRAARGIQPLL